ncbi:histidine kinase [Flindersiella endophytica]
MRQAIRNSPWWRVVIVFGAVTLAARLVFWLANALFGPSYSVVRHAFVAVLTAVLLVTISATARRFAEGLPLRPADPAERSGPRRVWRVWRVWRQILLGMACWLLPAAAGVAACLVLGLAEVTALRPAGEIALFAVALLVLVFLSEALPEELVFRGYVYRNLAQVLPVWAAVVTQAGLFTLWAFLTGVVGSPVRAVLLFTFAVLLGAVRAITGNVRFGVGFHLAFQTVAQLMSPAHPYFSVHGLEPLRAVAFSLLPFALAIPLLSLVRQGRRSAREWAADAGGMVGGLLVGTLFLFGDLITEPGKPIDVAWELVPGGLGCLLLLLFRRRRPVGVALALLPIAAMSAIGVGVAAIALFTVAAYRSRRITAGVAGLYAVTLTGVYWLALPGQDFWAAVVYVMFLLAIFVVSGLLVRAQRQLARRAELNQALRIEEARRLERERIAREMHDVLGHRISLLTLHAGALQYAPSAPAEVARAAGVIRECAYAAAEDLREVVRVLRAPDTDRPQPALTDLPGLVDQTRATGTPVTLDNRLDSPAAVPESVGRHLYRVVQEGLTNAHKHAPGRAVRVTLDGSPGEGVSVSLRNPAGGTVAAGADGAGLAGLRERVELAGGRISHGRVSPGGDFRLEAWLPWPP